MLLDSNIIIYAAQAEHPTLRMEDFLWISELKLLDPLASRP